MSVMAAGRPGNLSQAGPARAAQARDADLSIWPIVFVIYMTLLPREVHVSFGGNQIFADRLALLACLPLIANCLWRGYIKFVLPDWLVIFAGIWSVMAMWHAYDFERALFSGGSYAFDSIAGYYLARISFRSLTSLRRGLILCAPGFFLAGISVMAESLTHRFYVRPFFAAIFGEIEYMGGTLTLGEAMRVNDVRWGLLRGMGPWQHPILAGLHLSTLLPIYWMSSIRGWPRWVAIVAAAMSLFTLSSAAYGALALALILIFYEFLTKKIDIINWRAFLIVILFAMICVQTLTNSGIISLIIRYLTFDPLTGYFRQLIWDFGTKTVAQNVWFGIGFEPYTRPSWMYSDSVDNHWLLWAIRYGLPASLALFSACLVTIYALARSIMSTRSPIDSKFYRGIMMTLVILMLMMFTVTVQGGTLTWFTLILGGCVGCAQRAFFRKSAATGSVRMPHRI